MPVGEKGKKAAQPRPQGTNAGSPLPHRVRRTMTTVPAETKAWPLRVETIGCEVASELSPQALGLTYWLDVAPEGEPYQVGVRFVGHRSGVRGKPGPRDSFNVVETIDRVLPGSGPIAITARVYDIEPGSWQVTGAPCADARRSEAKLRSLPAERPRLPKGSALGTTIYAPIVGVCAPGAYRGVWPSLVALGAAIALATQALLAIHAHLLVTSVLEISLLACVVGLIAAKAYYMTGHLITGDHHGLRSLLSGGMCIQGFVLGAIGALVVGVRLSGAPVGPVLDVTAPGLLFAMTIGRFGCFFGGCCAGRPTASRWGLWSSDRRLGVRRVPSQLLEAAVALSAGSAALLLVLRTSPSPPGVIFVGAMASYTLGRQLVFPMRANPGHTPYGRTFMMVLAGGILLVDILVAASAK